MASTETKPDLYLTVQYYLLFLNTCSALYRNLLYAVVMRGWGLAEGHLADSPGRKVWWQLKDIIAKHKKRKAEKGGRIEKEWKRGRKKLMNSLSKLRLTSIFNILFIKQQKNNVLIKTNTFWSPTIISTTGWLFCSRVKFSFSSNSIIFATNVIGTLLNTNDHNQIFFFASLCFYYWEPSWKPLILFIWLTDSML